jgi:hypothetical protein
MEECAYMEKKKTHLPFFLILLVKTLRDASFQHQVRALTIMFLQLQHALHLVDSIASYSQKWH